MKIIKLLEEYKDALLDLIYPPVSIYDICDGPISFIPEHSCIKCGIGLRMIEDGPTCHECENSHYYFDRAVSVVKYEEDIKKLIYRFKYSRHTYLARIMGAMMGQKLRGEGINVDLIIPVPLHKKREKDRGFNQSVLLARYIKKEINVPLNINTLLRVKNTKVMHRLTKKERRDNVEDAFKVVENGVIEDKDILLIDDIFTTGATVNACSQLLKNSGAKSVTILTFARD